MAGGGQAEGIDEITEILIAARVFLSFEETAALAASVLDPDVVVLERVVDFCFHFAIDGIDDAAVGGVGEGGDLLVDGLEGLVEVLGAGGGQRTAAHKSAGQRTETAKPTKSTKGTGTDHWCGPGGGPVNSEQQ